MSRQLALGTRNLKPTPRRLPDILRRPRSPPPLGRHRRPDTPAAQPHGPGPGQAQGLPGRAWRLAP